MCIFLTFTQLSKLGIDPEIVPNLSYIIKLLKSEINMKTSILLYKYFSCCIYICSYVLEFWYPLCYLSEFSKHTLFYL